MTSLGNEGQRGTELLFLSDQNIFFYLQLLTHFLRHNEACTGIPDTPNSKVVFILHLILRARKTGVGEGWRRRTEVRMYSVLGKKNNFCYQTEIDKMQV